MAKHRKKSRAAKRFGASALATVGATGALVGLDGTAGATGLASSHFYIGNAPDRVTTGTTVRLVGSLQGYAGRDLASKTVYLQSHDSSGWHSFPAQKTYSNGRIGRSVTIKGSDRKYLRWYFKGDGSTRAAVSSYQRITPVSPGKRIVEKAASQAGDPYVYGAAGPDSFDCSGLTQYAHHLAGISIPRTSGDQYASSRHIAKTDKKPGDLLFFHNSSGSVYHAAVYAGSGQMWDAPESGDVVRKHDVWSSSYYVGRYW